MVEDLGNRRPLIRVQLQHSPKQVLEEDAHSHVEEEQSSDKSGELDIRSVKIAKHAIFSVSDCRDYDARSLDS